MADYKNDPLILRQIIMDHYEYPRNHQLKEDVHYHKAHMASESCIDDITVQMKITDNIIDDVCFGGVACTISTASTSVFTDLIKGKTRDEALAIIEEYYHMIDLKDYKEEILEEAIAFHSVGKQANRIKCATIGIKAMEQLIKESKDGQK